MDDTTGRRWISSVFPVRIPESPDGYPTRPTDAPPLTLFLPMRPVSRCRRAVPDRLLLPLNQI